MKVLRTAATAGFFQKGDRLLFVLLKVMRLRHGGVVAIRRSRIAMRMARIL
jgi:hypothetical protein